MYFIFALKTAVLGGNGMVHEGKTKRVRKSKSVDNQKVEVVIKTTIWDMHVNQM